MVFLKIPNVPLEMVFTETVTNVTVMNNVIASSTITFV